MKKLFLLTALSIALFSCSGNRNKSAVTNEFPVYELDELLKVAEQEVDNTVTVVGYVTHVCKHSGKRCFIVGESQKTSLRVEAAGDFGGFDRELEGSKLSITGVLMEDRWSEEFISEMEKNVHARMEEDGSVEKCAAELSNINDMRQWMKDNDKDYFVFYYMDGLSFDVLE